MVSTGSLARASARHPKRTLAIWLVVLVAALAAIVSLLDGTMTTEFYFFSNPDSKKADTLLEERLRGPADVREVVIVRSTEMTVDDEAFQESVTGLRGEIAGLGEGIVASGDMIPTAQFGFGMAVAILLDATIVRSILVPSTMKLLGDRNWYLPGFLSWLPQLQFEGDEGVTSPPEADATSAQRAPAGAGGD